jgi:hypothetical protein
LLGSLLSLSLMSTTRHQLSLLLQVLIASMPTPALPYTQGAAPAPTYSSQCPTNENKTKM